MTTLRRAAADDAPHVADLYLRARAAAAATGRVPPGIHPPEEVRRWFAEQAVPEKELWLAETTLGSLAGILVLDRDWVDALYVEPGLTGRGIGSELVVLAKRRRPHGLQLWSFESNLPAHRFYEGHGFVAADRTDGSGNEERSPDVRYVWLGRAG